MSNEPEKEKTDTANQNTIIPPEVSSTRPIGHQIETKTARENSNPSQYPMKPSRWSSFWDNIRQWLLVGFTGVLAWYTIQLVDVTTKQSKIVQAQAEISQKMLDAADISFKDQERAYVWVKSITIPDGIDIDEGQHIKVNVNLVNSGRTPATRYRFFRYITFGSNAERTIKTMSIPKNAVPLNGVIGPGEGHFGTAISDIIDKSTAEKFHKEMITIYIYGVIQYYDIFNRYHETGFCQVLKPFYMESSMPCDYGNWFDKRE